MEEDKIQVFIDGVHRYFNEVNKLKVDIGTPYLVENKNPKAHDYTGIIGVSGSKYRGCVYFTAPRVLLSNLLMAIGEEGSEYNIRDLIGEIANTIAGNARSEYGEEFMISVPIVITGAPDDIYLSADSRSCVIPIKYKQYSAAIVVSLLTKQAVSKDAH